MQELDEQETVWEDTNTERPEPMKPVSYLVKDSKTHELVRANGRILMIEATLEEKAKAQAFDAMGGQLEALTDRDRAMMELGNGSKSE